MRKSAEKIGFSMMVLFLVFAWFSHLGILRGGASGHMWGGIAMFVLALAGFVLLAKIEEGESAQNYFYCYFVLLILNAVFYIFLKSANVIGPYYVAENGFGTAWALGVIYCLFAILGFLGIYDCISVSGAEKEDKE